MASNIHEWLNLLIRMAHFVAGIMWIGTSFYFVWLDSAFTALTTPKPGVEGETHLVHGGYFYRVEKRRFGAGEMPKVLHWFKWEATFTWITGFLLLGVVYYSTKGAYLVDSAVCDITPMQATLIGLGTLAGGWFVYDLLFRSPLAQSAAVVNTVALALAAGLVWLLTHVFSGRGAFIHLGAVFGTIMVTNVWVHILPSQRAIIRAAQEGREPDYELGKKAKRRSMHNSYMTLPVLFTMISNHFASLYGNAANWLVLILVVVTGAMVRHTMISSKKWPLIPALAALAALVYMTMPQPIANLVDAPKVAFAQVQAVVQARCIQCHSPNPTDEVARALPIGVLVMLDSPEKIKATAPRIFERAVVQRTMPFNNKTQITEGERVILGQWIMQGADISP